MQWRRRFRDLAIVRERLITKLQPTADYRVFFRRILVLFLRKFQDFQSGTWASNYASS
jgi:hypothetical protein